VTGRSMRVHRAAVFFGADADRGTDNDAGTGVTAGANSRPLSADQ